LPKIHLYLVLNLDEHYQPRGMLSLETNLGSVVPVFTTADSAQRFLMSPRVQGLIEQGDGPKGVIEDTAASFEEWLLRMRMTDRSLENVTYLLDTDPVWRDLSAQLG
jgi:hypothetical protein